MHQIISLGAGVQSTTLALMAAHGEIGPKPEMAIFADTQWEPKKVYRHLEWLKVELARFGIPVVVATAGSLREQIVQACNSGDRFASIPFYTINADGEKGMVRRQCTSEFKIRVILAAARRELGLTKHKMPPGTVKQWIGISLDEIERAKPSHVKWAERRHPLLEMEMTRLDCMTWLTRKGYAVPPKSSCIGCPFHDDHTWLDMKRNDPESWHDAVEIDRMVRKLPRFSGQAFLHPSCRPLEEVNLNEDQMEMDLFINECEGVCGV